MNKKTVLVLDDVANWTELISETIHKQLGNGVDVTTVNNEKNWEQKFSASSYWDVIIIDVKLNMNKNGAQLGKRIILDHGIMSPIIIVSSNVNLEKFENEYGDIFFQYIHKDNLDKFLSDAVDKACKHDERKSHIKKILLTLCKQFDLLEKNVLVEEIMNEELKQIFVTNNGITFNNLIEMVYGTGNKLDLCGKAIIDIINKHSNDHTKTF